MVVQLLNVKRAALVIGGRILSGSSSSNWCTSNILWQDNHTNTATLCLPFIPLRWINRVRASAGIMAKNLNSFDNSIYVDKNRIVGASPLSGGR